MHNLHLALPPLPPLSPVGVYDTQPWDWSLNSVIAGLGAAGTILVAVFALIQTMRANGLQERAQLLEEQARARTDRVAAAGLIKGFLASWEPHGVESVKAGLRLPLEAAEISAEAGEFAEWLVSALNEVIANEHRQLAESGMDKTEFPPQPNWEWIAETLRTATIYRIAAWTETGKIDRSPLLSPPRPTPRQVPTDETADGGGQ